MSVMNDYAAMARNNLPRTHLSALEKQMLQYVSSSVTKKTASRAQPPIMMQPGGYGGYRAAAAVRTDTPGGLGGGMGALIRPATDTPGGLGGGMGALIRPATSPLPPAPTVNYAAPAYITEKTIASPAVKTPPVAAAATTSTPLPPGVPPAPLFSRPARSPIAPAAQPTVGAPRPAQLPPLRSPKKRGLPVAPEPRRTPASPVLLPITRRRVAIRC